MLANWNERLAKGSYELTTLILYFRALTDRAALTVLIKFLSKYKIQNQPSSVCGWMSAFLLTVHRLCGVIEIVIEIAAELAQDGLAECNQSGKNPLEYSAVVGN